VASFFTSVRVYAYPNTGTFYDLGFLLGATVWAHSTTYVYVKRSGASPGT
jgi:hypothetical protein